MSSKAKKAFSTKTQKPSSRAHIRPDGELYARPTPNPFSENWLDGYKAGYDGDPIKSKVDKEWRDGFYTGHEQRALDQEEMDRVNSSNA